MLKLLKQYKFIILVLLVCLIGIGGIAYEKSTSQEFLLETELPQEAVVQAEELSSEGAKEIISLEQAQESKNIQIESTFKAPQIVPIYICGAVQNPGVYYMADNALINEVIQISGGFTEEANTEYLNLASPIQANGKIVVPKKGEEIDKSLDSYDNKESIMTETANIAPAILQDNVQCININLASEQELMSLPGIGEKKAAAIKAYREANGGFKEISELTKVDGIGNKTFENIQELIIVQ